MTSFLGAQLMSDDEDLVDDIEIEVELEEPAEPELKAKQGEIDARRKLEAKLEEVQLRKMTQEYDF
ncbi:MAG: hypothetical protein HOL48_01915 [Porticoccaceae bacterium]|nr:hypothetical protein [Porticoccaceae bacterium]